MEYDVVVIGGGPGGYVAAIRAAQAGKKTALIEKEKVGGVCLNRGCIPTKALIKSAQLFKEVKESEVFGVITGDISADYDVAHKRSREVVERLVKGVSYLLKKNKVDVISAEAAFVDKNTVIADGRTITSEYFIVATGASSKKLQFLDYSYSNIIDASGALELTNIPKSMVIIGGGVIGVEFATIFASFGTNVTIVEVMDGILINCDKDIASFVEKELKKTGVKILCNAKINSVNNEQGKCTLDVITGEDVQSLIIETEFILVAAGIYPNSREVQLEKIGIEIDEQGFVLIDNCMKTNISNIFAIGDVTGKLALAHVASKQAEVAVKTICNKNTHEVNYANVPKCIFSNPECASIGLTLEEAIRKNIKAKTAVFPIMANGKAIATGDDRGFVKVVFDEDSKQICGIHMVGQHVTEMIGSFSGYINLKVTIDDICEHTVFPHPTVSESIIESFLVALGEPVHI